MLETQDDWGIAEKTAFIIDHLECESKYLDKVIVCSSEIHESLRMFRDQEPAATTSSSSATKLSLLSFTPNQEERNKELTEMMARIRLKMSEDVEPILPIRKQFVEVIRSLVPDWDRAPSLTSLALMVDEPLRSKLKQLRSEIRGKLRKIQTIAMGNQAVLIYTMDFFNRLLTGISDSQLPEKCYNSAGQTKNQSTGNFIQTNG